MKRRIVEAKVCSFALAACLSDEKSFGRSAVYEPGYPNPIQVSMPANAPSITQQFRAADPYPDPRWGEHFGIDVHAPIGTPVIAAAGGRVIESFWEPAYGNRVLIQHPTDASGIPPTTRYVHLKTRTVEKGEYVQRGQQIGELGTTGLLSSGFPHLHMEVTYGGYSLKLSGKDPHLFWVDGVGRVTCFEPKHRGLPSDPFKITYPVLCK
ncbi:M23 family metallopeptidase [Cognatishimia sp.]|uniref:M23 family metallopeptidase n=1 Tax=Cognatishimia sp. TaxID=2211648 RepID=UPI003514A3D7